MRAGKQKAHLRARLFSTFYLLEEMSQTAWISPGK